jgi:putative ABC transport system permease protein
LGRKNHQGFGQDLAAVNKKNVRPPKCLEWILKIVANRGESSAIIGDFKEEFLDWAEKEGIRRARRLYRQLALRSIPSFIKSHFYWSGQMFQNQLKIFIRNIQNHKAYSFINISGLAIAMAASLMIFLFVSFEFSYDRFHDNIHQLYRIRNDRIYADIHDKSAGCPPALGPALKKEFPEILESARVLTAADMNNIVSYVPSGEYIQNIEFSLEGFDKAKKVALIGTFNGWNPDRHILKRKGNQWQCQIFFPPGRYSYRFVVDGEEICDPENPEQAKYKSESYSILTVKEPPIDSKKITFLETKIFYAEACFLKMFSFPMKLGSRESALENPQTAVISKTAAQRYFGDDDPIGKMILLSNQNGKQLYTITGVFEDIPENSHIKFDFLLSFPTLIQLRPNAAYDWGWNMFNTYVLLAPETDPRSLQEKFKAFVDRQKIHGKDYRREFILQPIKDIHLHSHLRWEPEVNGNAKTVYFLMIIALFILLIAWINYINLSTARSITRAKEVGIRKVLGSRRWQLIRQFISESALFNLCSLLVALFLILIFLPHFNQLTGKQLSLSLTNAGFAWFWMALFFLVGTSLSSIYPALILSSFSPDSVFRGLFSHTHKGIRFRKIMVIFQFSLSVILIIGTLTVSRQVKFMQNKDLGIQIEQTLAVRIPGNQGYSTERVERFKRELKNSSRIKGVTASSSVPGKEYSNASSGIRPLASNPEDGKRCFFISVDYDYFDFYGHDFVAGRKFVREFSADPRAAILNEVATRLFGYQSPEKVIGEKILLGGLGGEIRHVVGVVKDFHHKSLKDNLQPILFTLTEGDQNSRHNYFSIKMGGQDIDRTIAFIAKAWDNVYPGTPFDYFFLDESFHNLYQSDRRFSKVFSLFALLSIFISCLGLFGLAAFMAEQRTKEIGIRRVLGATTTGIVYLLSREFLKWILASNLIAWPVAYFAMNRWLQNFAFRTRLGIGMFFLAASLSLTIALCTIITQSIKTANANPADTLRHE